MGVFQLVNMWITSFSYWKHVRHIHNKCKHSYSLSWSSYMLSACAYSCSSELLHYNRLSAPLSAICCQWSNLEAHSKLMVYAGIVIWIRHQQKHHFKLWIISINVSICTFHNFKNRMKKNTHHHPSTSWRCWWWLHQRHDGDDDDGDDDAHHHHSDIVMISEDYYEDNHDG